MPTAASVLLVLALCVLALVATGSVVYLLTLLCAAAVAGRRRNPVIAPDASLRLDVIVPAHDEEPVLAATLRSLRAQNYPGHLTTIIVVADNCTDRTAEIARSFPGVVVLERNNETEKGKGYALDWALTQRLALSHPADAFVIVDADTEAEPEFLRRLSSALLARRDAQGRAAVQGRYGVLNVQDGWRAALMAGAFELVNHIKPLGADTLGLSVDLKGNGMGFTREVFASGARWSGRSITEDIDFGLDLLDKYGVRVGYAPEAVVRAQMPVNGAQAAPQRDRWERGRYRLMRQRAFPLLWSGIRHADLRRMEAGIRLLVPPLAELGSAAVALLGVAVAGRISGLLPHSSMWLGLSAATLLGFCLYVLLGLRVAGAPRAAYAALFRAPAYIFWKLARYTLRATDAWVRTDRIPVPQAAGSTDGRDPQ